MVVVGLASGWWNSESKTHQRSSQALRELEAENNHLRHEERFLKEERDKAIQDAKEYRRLDRNGMFGRP
jgi:hypothetical protein